MNHGLRGLIRHQPITDFARAMAPVACTAPSTADFTFGRKTYGMQGNDKWSNCWWAGLVHVSTVQATVSFDEHPTFVSGYTPLGPNTGQEWYNRFQVSLGQKVEAPGQGTDPSQGIAFALQEKLIYAGGVVGQPLTLETVAEAIYDFQGGVIYCLALDDDAEQEFDDQEPWGTESSVPDDNDGHATTGVIYDLTSTVPTTCITWAALEGMTGPFDANCIEGFCPVITQGFILKNGQAQADALVAKWQLQTQGES